nr:hypothetical protein CFP56_08557 [Quercus suber]
MQEGRYVLFLPRISYYSWYNEDKGVSRVLKLITRQDRVLSLQSSVDDPNTGEMILTSKVKPIGVFPSSSASIPVLTLLPVFFLFIVQ